MRREITKREFIKKARSLGYEPHKNNIHNAKSIDKVCGTVKAKYRTPTEELLAPC